jgi:N-methylhydantoinase A/oxoprolinase/acetone carboxylase beta subunit
VKAVGVDSGGTFTDVVDAAGRVRKLSSTPSDPGAAVRSGVAALAGGELTSVLAHGTTVATNALLERTGASVTLVTTAGFEDVIEIARQDRPLLFDHWTDRPEPLVDADHRLGVVERVGADASVVVPLDLGSLPPIPADTRAVAVCLLNSVIRADHEHLVAAALAEGGHDVSSSSLVAPEFREYERTVTTVLNASLRPVVTAYLDGLADVAEVVLVMTSAGGLVPLARASELPVHLLLSGPAAGAIAAAAAATANGFTDAITFDMGGTSTDVCLVRQGRPEPAGRRDVAGFPVLVPSLDILTIGAGGGSIAWRDDGGALRVGPRSAGAVPGPACYGRGGRDATVTDADLAAGRIDAGASLGDLGSLDRDAASRALARLGVSAVDVIAVVDAEMTQALRTVSVELGVDPRGMALVAFGGAGPLHACALADELGMAAVIVPSRAGVLSAVGLLSAPLVHDVVVAWPHGVDVAGLEDFASALAAAATDQVSAAVGETFGPSPFVASEVSFDCRYLGQSHELRVAHPDEFGAAHRRVNGTERPGDPVEVVAVRARAWVARARAGALGAEPLIDGPRRGPLTIATADSTSWVPEGWVATPGVEGALVIRREEAR